MSRVKNVLRSSLGLAHTGEAWGKVRPVPGLAGGTYSHRNPKSSCVLVMEARPALRSELEKPGVARADVFGFWWAGGQAGGQAGKAASGVCGQASWSPGRWPPDKGGPWSLGAKSIRVGEGWLCNYDATVTEKVTLLCSTASFLPPQKDTKI